MARAESLPSVLSPKAPDSPISMVRALKQVLTLLEEVTPENDSHQDRLNASIDDVTVMLENIT